MVEAKALLPFVLFSYGEPSPTGHDEGGQSPKQKAESRATLTPLLFSIAIQGALEEVSKSLKAGEYLCGFLDDVHLVCEPERVRLQYDSLAEALSTMAGIRLHQGKHVWNAIGQCPEDIADLGPEVWCMDGIKVLGTPLGSTEFVSSIMEERVRKNEGCGRPSQKSLTYNVLGKSCCRVQVHAPIIPSEQSPSASKNYAREHDEGIWSTAKALLNEVPGSEQELTDAAQVASLPMRTV